MTLFPRRNLSSPRTAINPHGFVSVPGDEYDALFKLQYEVESLKQQLANRQPSQYPLNRETSDPGN